LLVVRVIERDGIEVLSGIGEDLRVECVKEVNCGLP
jgi:hypothetical protein